MLWFADRYKDVIKTGGENVASIEVEKAVYAADPRVAEVVVVGLPHERWSEAITAVVVPKPGETSTRPSCSPRCEARLDGYKVPKAVIVVGRAAPHVDREDPEEPASAKPTRATTGAVHDARRLTARWRQP